MTKKHVKITWYDAVSYYSPSQIPDGVSEEVTTGELIEQTNAFVIIKDPQTEDFDGRNHRGIGEQEGDPAFLFIPRGMIVNIEEV